MLLQLCDMNAPVMCREGLELARSLVKDSSMIEEIKSWKDKHLHNDEPDISRHMREGTGNHTFYFNK